MSVKRYAVTYRNGAVRTKQLAEVDAERLTARAEIKSVEAVEAEQKPKSKATSRKAKTAEKRG